MSDIEFDIIESAWYNSVRYKVNVKPNKRIKYNTPLIQDYVDDQWREVAIFSSREVADYFISLVEADKVA